MELEQMKGKKVEITTKTGEIHSGILADIIEEYIHLESPDGSGEWVPKKSITNVKEVKSV